MVSLGKGGYTGSFFTGVLATVVATPCTAPLMGAAIGFALSQHALVTFAVFTALALGLALPYLALTFVPGSADKLPRPGRWMETLKQLTSVPLFLTVVWLVWVYGHLTGSSAQDGIDHVARLLVRLVVLAIAGWILGRWPARRLGYLAAATVVVAALLFLSPPHMQTGFSGNHTRVSLLKRRKKQASRSLSTLRQHGVSPARSTKRRCCRIGKSSRSFFAGTMCCFALIGRATIRRSRMSSHT